MNSGSRTVVALFLAAAFLIGAVAGAAGGYRYARHQPPPRHPKPAEMAERVLADLTRDLELTPEQVVQIRPLISGNCERIGDLRREGFEKMRAYVQETNQKIAAFLNETQRRKLEELERRWHKPGPTNTPTPRP